MIHVIRRLEYRVVIPGRPESFRSKKALAYKQAVRRFARQVLATPLPWEELDVRIDYFHAGRRRFDMDNIAKCILDALNGVGYVDDVRVRLQSSEAHCLLGPVSLPAGPLDLVKPLRDHDEYVFVRVRDGRRRSRK